ncbi:hypothetical protein HNP92_001776 [Methanococcus maripaludis]|uniref:Uncharacterized protein n=1 Tax=Methanococcus maripaludis TaxID=39152 RepID=A0A7J9S9A0_METMI|nr:hypothetical protein [Methanococcus maripaludis]MBB6402454.1 hypothetical protein [Methanococcus maripaludis]
MKDEVLEIIFNYWAISTKKELAITIGIPLIISVLILLIDGSTVSTGIGEFINTILTIAALLVAFSVASITVLFTSSSKNIEEARNYYGDTEESKRYTARKSAVSFFQTILIKNFYAVIVQIFLIAVGIISKLALLACQKNQETQILDFVSYLFSFEVPNICYNLIVSFEVFLLIHSLLVLTSAIFDIYFLMWRSFEE